MNNDLEVAHPQSGSSATWFLVELEFGNVGFWGEGKTGVPGEKPLGAKERTNNKLNPHMASTSGFEPGPHWWGASAPQRYFYEGRKPETISFCDYDMRWIQLWKFVSLLVDTNAEREVCKLSYADWRLYVRIQVQNKYKGNTSDHLPSPPPIYFFFRQVLLTYWRKTSLSERELQHRLSYIW